MVKPPAVPEPFESHNHFLAANGIPWDLYYAALKAGQAPEDIATEPFAKWDAGWPCRYKDQPFPNYHKMCDFLESAGKIRRWQPRPFGPTGTYDIPERDVLQWLSATGRLAQQDADEWIAKVVAPLRHDSKHHSNIRANRRNGVALDACARCAVNLQDHPEQVVIRPVDSSDPPFERASRRKDFDPSRYHAWCRSCVAHERWAKRRGST